MPILVFGTLNNSGIENEMILQNILKIGFGNVNKNTSSIFSHLCFLPPRFHQNFQVDFDHLKCNWVNLLNVYMI